MPKPYRRGYPVAVLVGIEVDHASIWQIFSQVAKPQQKIALTGARNDAKATYSFHENIVNALRPTLKQGVKSIIVAAPQKTSFAQEFLGHIKGHQSWLIQGQNKASINTVTGSASTPQQVAALTKTEAFKELISETTSEETENLLEILEKKLSQTDNLVHFSLEEAENLILYRQAEGKPQPEYLLLTDVYLAGCRQRGRLQRLMQIAQNRGVKTRVIPAESNAGKRLAQFGGVVCIAKAV